MSISKNMLAQAPLKLVVLISGRGSNLSALIDAIQAKTLNAEITAVISNKADAKGLELAQKHTIPTTVIDHKMFSSREHFDEALASAIQHYSHDLIILAGFMRVLTAHFVNHFFPKIINIHPSILPAFTGLHTHERAMTEGVKFHGCTVHAVTAELDHGPILGQGIVPVYAHDSAETLAARVLNIEHQLLPAVIQSISEKKWVMSTNGWHYDKQNDQTSSTDTTPIPSGFWHIG
jgi:phosphoribosylglycinamide formyltransferase-1